MSLDHRSLYAGKPFGWGGLLALFVLVLMAGVAKSARADVMLNIVDTGDPTDTGTISFPGFSGTDATGVTFSFGNFVQSQITALTYSIDPGTDGLLSLSLTAHVGDSVCNAGISICESTTFSMNTTEATTVTMVCEGGFCSNEEDSDVFISFSPVNTSVTPEPSSMMLFGSGLLGVWGVVKRRRNS
jgi:hypothetical protein